MSGPVERDGEDLILALRVQPRASRNELLLQGEQLKLKTTAAPVDGEANAELIAFLAKQFRVAKGQIELLSGETGRSKRLRIRAPKQLPPAIARLLSL